jgi:hypothetical protein
MYDALSRQRTDAFASQQQQAVVLQASASSKLAELKQGYPETALQKQATHGTEYRVPLLLSVSVQPLFIKLTLGP